MSDELPALVERVEAACRWVRDATRVKDEALAERKAALRALAGAGMSLAQIAALVGISRSRVGLILHDNKTLNPGSRKKKPKRAAPVRRVYVSGDALAEWDGTL